MKTSQSTSLVIGFVILWILAACGGGAPTPATNPPAVETSLAGTALALAKQTEAANPYTATPSITPSPTLTSTPKISLQGTSLFTWEDGSALFVDHKAGIQMVIPTGWMPMRVNEQEYYDAFTSDVVLANPAMSDRLTQIQSVNLDEFRLDAIDIRDGHVVNGVISDISVIFAAGDMRTLDKWASVAGNQRRPFKNFKLVSMGYRKTTDETKILVIEQSWSKDESNKIFYRGVYFSLPNGTLVLDFQTNDSLKETVLPDFEQVVNSVALLNP